MSQEGFPIEIEIGYNKIKVKTMLNISKTHLFFNSKLEVKINENFNAEFQLKMKNLDY